MEQSKAMEYGSRKASPDVLKLRVIYNRHITFNNSCVDFNKLMTIYKYM